MSASVETVRHSAAHVMAEAVQKLYPGTKFGIGPAIEDGFYYDFQLPKPITDEDLPAIEKEMRRIISSGPEFLRREISKDEARELFAEQPFKLELIEELEGTISTYEQDGFVDLCRGPHVSNAREIRPDAFKLRAVAGAYWRGDDAAHFLLDGRQVLVGNGLRELEVVIEAVVDRGADAELGPGIELLDGLGHHV